MRHLEGLLSLVQLTAHRCPTTGTSVKQVSLVSHCSQMP
jgi:hypothetical protein